MKKNLTFLVLSILFLACSKSDSDENKLLPLVAENITGVWYFSKVIKSNGEVVDYINMCPTKRDYVDFYVFQSIADYRFLDTNCSTSYVEPQCVNYVIAGNRLSACNSKYNGL